MKYGILHVFGVHLGTICDKYVLRFEEETPTLKIHVCIITFSSLNVLFKEIFKKILFIYFWLHWVFIAARGLSLVAVRGGYSSLQCRGFSLRWLLLLRSTGSRHVGFSSCGSRASVVVACRL